MIQPKNHAPIPGANTNMFYAHFPRLLLWGWLCLGCAMGTAQAQQSLSTKSKKAIGYYHEADNYRVRRQFPQAISLLEEAIRKDAKFVEAYIRLGTVYMDMRKVAEARRQFEQAFALQPNDKAYGTLYYWLGEIYVLQGEYEKAKAMLRQFLGYKPKGKIAQQAGALLQNAEYALENTDNNLSFNPRPLKETVNRYHLQYFPVLTVDQKQLIFTRRLGVGPAYDEDLVVSVKDAAGKWGLPQSISDKINTQNNEGTCTISADGRMLIFTSCLGRKGYGSCDLFATYKTGDAWSVPENLGPVVNSSAWESQPSLSADGRVLYFVSDRKGGIGRRDIYMTNKGRDGVWSKPQNLGPNINTVKDEVSPFIHANGKTLYFATNGLTGFGGFDIFFSERQNKVWGKPANLGGPVNTGEDQLSLFITADGKKGYYSHESYSKNMVRGKLYEFDVPEAMQVKYKSNFIAGKVIDKATKGPLKAKIELFDLKANELVSLTESDSLTGEYMMVLTEGSAYALYVDKVGYLFESLSFNYEQAHDLAPIHQDVMLQPVKIGGKATLKNIFFDVDKHDLKDKSKTELDKVARFLKSNPSVRIEIGGHTDNTGSAVYNTRLSLKRAEAVFNHLITLGIQERQMRYKGYGQTQPVAPNDSDKNKEKNRRIEFVVVQQ